MPELPEVEVVARALDQACVGRTIQRVDLHRTGLRTLFVPDTAAKIQGRKIQAVRRVGKSMVMELDDGARVLMHLGMSGKIRVAMHPSAQSEVGRHDHVVMDLSGGLRWIFNDVRRFGAFTWLADEHAEATHPTLSRLGCDPVVDEAWVPAFTQKLRGKRQSIKVALMDQRTIAGVGNIYANEALHACQMAPTALAANVAREEALVARLAYAIEDTLRRAIRAGGSTLRDYAHVDGEAGYFQHSFLVYGRQGEPCLTCSSGRIRREVLGGRATYYCETCQSLAPSTGSL